MGVPLVIIPQGGLCLPGNLSTNAVQGPCKEELQSVRFSMIVAKIA
jgi:hypothetical protein